MPSANANPAAQINFIFRQLPDDVLDQIGAHRGGAYHQDAEASGVPPESVIAAVGGAAVAAGQDTLTIGFVQNVGKDHGGYSIIVGDATFEASAQSPEAGGAAAAANTFLTVSGDYIIQDQISHGGSGPNDAGASSEIAFVAVNINGWSPEGGPVVIELHQPGNQVGPDGHQPPDGNYAAVIATADAHGAHSSLTATTTIALTVENQFSLVTGISVVGV